MTLRQASIEPFGSLHGSNGYGALMEEQKLKNRCTPCSWCPFRWLWQQQALVSGRRCTSIACVESVDADDNGAF